MHRAEKVRGPFKRRIVRHFRYAKAILANWE